MATTTPAPTAKPVTARRWILGSAFTAVICYLFVVTGTGFNAVTGEFDTDRLRFNVFGGLFGGLVSTLVVLLVIGVAVVLFFGVRKIIRMKDGGTKVTLVFIGGAVLALGVRYISFGWMKNYFSGTDLVALIVVLLIIGAVTWIYSCIMRNK